MNAEALVFSEFGRREGAPLSRRSKLYPRDRVVRFYKKGCQEKNSASTGGREDFGLEIQPTVCKCAPSIRSRGFALAGLPFRRFHSGGDHANRVLKLGKRNRYLSVHHGSIRGSWPIAISGYPRAHSV
jgi:hypothetical protein